MDDKTRADFWEAIAEAREESNQKFIQAVRDVAKHGIKREEYEALQARIKELEEENRNLLSQCSQMKNQVMAARQGTIHSNNPNRFAGQTAEFWFKNAEDNHRQRNELQIRVNELETVLAVRNATEYTFPVTYAELCELAEKVPLPGTPSINECIRWVTEHLPRLLADSRRVEGLLAQKNDVLFYQACSISLTDRALAAEKRIKELEARNAELEKIDARFVADAELGRLVRAMPNGFELQHHGRIWFCVQYPRTEHHLQVDASTPEEALKKAGIGKEAEPPQEWRSRPPTVCQQYEMYKGGAYPRSCPTCGLLGKCQYEGLKIEAEPPHSPE